MTPCSRFGVVLLLLTSSACLSQGMRIHGASQLRRHSSLINKPEADGVELMESDDVDTVGTTSLHPVYHFVAFRFKSSVNKRQKKNVSRKLFALKRRCKGILEVSFGGQNSLESVHQDYEQGFVVKFRSERARDEYVGCTNGPCYDYDQKGKRTLKEGYLLSPNIDDVSQICQAHDKFKNFVGSLLDVQESPSPANYQSGVLVFDYLASRPGDHDRNLAHMVFFRFKPGTSTTDMNLVRDRFLALKKECGGIKELAAGPQNSLEAVDQLYHQGYWVLLEDEVARDRYVGCTNGPCYDYSGAAPTLKLDHNLPSGLDISQVCAAHDEFKAFVGPFLDLNLQPSGNYNPGVFVFDFINEPAKVDTPAKVDRPVKVAKPNQCPRKPCRSNSDCGAPCYTHCRPYHWAYEPKRFCHHAKYA